MRVGLRYRADGNYWIATSMSYWELTDQQRRSFSGRSFRYVSLDTPLELYSFNSREDRPCKPDPARPNMRDPMFFLTKSNLTEAIARRGVPKDLFDLIRRGVALCEDWGNDLSFMFILNIPEGLNVHAWVGLAKFQPRGRNGAGLLEGGWLQYIVDVDEQLKHYLDGPIRTRW
jgi:hypothetical protein